MGFGGGREEGWRNEGAWRTGYPEADGFCLAGNCVIDAYGFYLKVVA